MGRPYVSQIDSTFFVIRGMLDADEHMNDTRHSHGSCLSTRMPRYRTAESRSLWSASNAEYTRARSKSRPR